MGLEYWIKNGWFDDLDDIDLPLNNQQIQDIRNGKEIFYEDDKITSIIYLKKGFDLNNLSVKDLIIRVWNK